MLNFLVLLCVCAILPAKAIPEMTYTVSGGTLNPTYSLTTNIVEFLWWCLILLANIHVLCLMCVLTCNWM